jgi:hypothetical protein
MQIASLQRKAPCAVVLSGRARLTNVVTKAPPPGPARERDLRQPFQCASNAASARARAIEDAEKKVDGLSIGVGAQGCCCST